MIYCPFTPLPGQCVMLTREGSCMQPAVRESTNSRTCPLWRPDFSGEALWKLLSSISSQSARCLWTAQRKVLRTVMKKNSSRPGCLCSPSACLPLSHIFQTAFLNKRELFLPGSQYPESQTVRLSWRFLFLGSLGMPFFFLISASGYVLIALSVIITDVRHTCADTTATWALEDFSDHGYDGNG